MVERATRKEVNDFHRNSDVNANRDAQHHTIGLGAGQVAPGKHYHDGRDSPLLLEGLVVTGSRSTDSAAVIGQIMVLLKQLGATDGTTA